MALELQTHQQDAYDNVKKYFEESDRSIVIFPTGCGKSFVSLKLMEENRDSKILFICPSEPIQNQMYEYIIKYLSTEETDKKIKLEEERKKRELGIREKTKIILPNFKAMLYQTIISKSEKSQEVLSKLKPDYIICDEVHHIKTRTQQDEIDKNDEDDIEKLENIWGKAMVEFTEKNPQAKILGITATPERGDGVNVAIEFFNKNIASEISLIQAITNDKIPIKAPDCIPCVYTLIDEIDEGSIQEQIEKYKVSNPKKAEELQKKLEEMRKVADSGKGLSDLFTEHLTTPEARKLGRDKGKYIVFCENIEDMKQKMEESKIWFSGVDDEPEIYAVSSKYNYSPNNMKNNNEYSQNVIADFEKSQSNHLKLLFSVNMLNEGLHVDDVTGVIMTRKTNSRNIYLQQLGRAISSNSNKPRPLVFDIANNYLTYNIYDELISMRKKQEQKQSGFGNDRDSDDSEYTTHKQSEENWIETFRVNGIMRDLLELLEANRNVNRNVAQEFIEICRKLKGIGIDCSKMVNVDTIESICKKQGVDIGVAINTGLDLNKKIGNTKATLTKASRGKGDCTPATKEQEKILKEEFSIIFKEKDVAQEFIEICRKLKNVGIDCSQIVQKDTIESICKKQGVDIKLAEDVGLDTNKKIGKMKANLTQAGRGNTKGKPATKEQEDILREEFGITFDLIEKKDVAQEFIETCRKLKDIGIDCSKMVNVDTIESICKKQGVDIKLAENIGVDINKKIGSTKEVLAYASRGKGDRTSATKEQEKILREEFGISFEIKKEKTPQGKTVLIFIETCRKLKSIGIDCSKISSNDTIESLCEKQKVDIELAKIAGVDVNKKIGNTKDNLARASRGKGNCKPATKEQEEVLREEFGITFDKKGKSSKQLGKVVAKDIPIEETQKAIQFLDSITEEKRIEGDGNNEQRRD